MLPLVRLPSNGDQNVSIVDTTTNEIIGEAVKDWPEWPLTTPGATDDSKQPLGRSTIRSYLTRVSAVDFNVTLPAGLESTCDVAGKCVLQWFWYAIKNKQSYESCVDFYIKPSGASNSTCL